MMCVLAGRARLYLRPTIICVSAGGGGRLIGPLLVVGQVLGDRGHPRVRRHSLVLPVGGDLPSRRAVALGVGAADNRSKKATMRKAPSKWRWYRQLLDLPCVRGPSQSNLWWVMRKLRPRAEIHSICAALLPTAAPPHPPQFPTTADINPLRCWVSML